MRFSGPLIGMSDKLLVELFAPRDADFLDKMDKLRVKMDDLKVWKGYSRSGRTLCGQNGLQPVRMHTLWSKCLHFSLNGLFGCLIYNATIQLLGKYRMIEVKIVYLQQYFNKVLIH